MRRTLASVGSALGLVVAFQAPANAAIGPVLQSCTIGKVAVVHWHQTKSAWMNIYWTFSYLQYPGNEHFPPEWELLGGLSVGEHRAAARVLRL
jgi:hypothetical protein